MMINLPFEDNKIRRQTLSWIYGNQLLCMYLIDLSFCNLSNNECHFVMRQEQKTDRSTYGGHWTRSSLSNNQEVMLVSSSSTERGSWETYYAKYLNYQHFLMVLFGWVPSPPPVTVPEAVKGRHVCQTTFS